VPARDDRSPAERLADQESRARKEVQLEQKASNILDSPLLKDAIEAVKDQLYKEFAASALEDDNLRLRARIGIEMLDRVLKHLRHHIDTGKMARVALAEVEEKKRQARKRAA
jgi:hypothetical protein